MGNFGDKIANLCLKHFAMLPKHGKPENNRQWTVLSTFVRSQEEELKVVALGTGTSCLGSSEMCKSGRLLHDSHAEVIARRAFNRYLFEELSKAYDPPGSSSIFVLDHEEGTCQLKSNVKFHFYTSHPPCGDASIYPIEGQKIQLCHHNFVHSIQEKRSTIKRKQPDDHPLSKYKCLKSLEKTEENNLHDVADINRTGAKNAPGEKSDSHLQGVNYHNTGLLRTKPGRGVKTLSMSCSDKIMKWNIMGCQGCLAMFFIDKPIYLSSLIVTGSAVMVSALQRAIVGRISQQEIKTILNGTSYSLSQPLITDVDVVFQFSKSHCSELIPCGSAVSWTNVKSNSHEVVAKSGLRLGVTMKQKHTEKAVCSICRAKLFDVFKQILLKIPSESKLKKRLDVNLSHLQSYNDFKVSTTDHAKVWNSVKRTLFPNWVAHDRSLDKF